MGESWKTRLLRWRLNLFPAYRGTGAHIISICSDYSQVRIALPLGWRTKNHYGAIFGGSIYAAVDPVYVMMLIFCLRRNDIRIWTKSSTIHFKKPGRCHLYATFVLTEPEIHEIHQLLNTSDKVDRQYLTHLVDRHGEIYAEIEQIVSIRKRTTQA